MAEIKVLKGQETQVGPIGIVQMGSSGVRAGQRLQQAGQRLFDVAFKVAYDNEKQKGQEEAGLAAISARDPNTGKLTFPEIPKSLSPVAQNIMNLLQINVIKMLYLLILMKMQNVSHLKQNATQQSLQNNFKLI